MSFFLKVLVVGETSTGKTSLVNRLVSNTYNEQYKATVGCEFGFKVMESGGETVRVQLWDLAGQDRLGGISRLYCRDAHGALVVCDVTKPETIAKVAKWKEQVDEYAHCSDGSGIPMVLCMNKADLVKEATGQEILDRQGKEVQVAQAFLTSAKTTMNVEEAFESLVKAIMKKRAELPPSVIEGRSQNPGGGLKLARQAIDSKSTKRGCCKAG